jgi:hypothetical protein
LGVYTDDIRRAAQAADASQLSRLLYYEGDQAAGEAQGLPRHVLLINEAGLPSSPLPPS